MKTYLLAIVLFVCGNMAYAQTIQARTGVRGGFSAANLRISEVEERNTRYGFHISAFTQIPLVEDFIYLQPEITYINKGTRARFDVAGLTGDNTFKLNYIEVPVLATFKVGNAVDIHAGPYAAYLLKGALENRNNIGGSTNFLTVQDFKRMDYGIGIGLSLYFRNFLLATRYNLGLRKVADGTVAETVLGNAKNTSVQLSVGVTF